MLDPEPVGFATLIPSSAAIARHVMPKSMDAAAISLGTRFVGIPQLDADVATVILLGLGCTLARHVAVD